MSPSKLSWLNKLSLFGQGLRVLCIFACATYFGSTLALAEERVGVGVGSGKIHVEEVLFSGQTYAFPSLTVINTGTVKAEYSIHLTFHENQEQQRPEQDWFRFHPQTFSLEPGQAQLVEISAHFPLITPPGAYFAYLEAAPTHVENKGGSASIGIAAASKLTFTVGESSLAQAGGNWLKTIFTRYQAYILSVVGMFFLVPLIHFLRHNVDIRIKVKSKDHENSH